MSVKHCWLTESQFGFLSPYELRLVKKLQPPITELISTTPAISLLYECVHTCIVGGMLRHASGDSLAELCVTKLAAFLQDPDQNRKKNLPQSGPYLKNYSFSEVHRASGTCQNSPHTSQSSGTIPRHDNVQYQRSGPQHSHACS
jgi:hypothetical protein